MANRFSYEKPSRSYLLHDRFQRVEHRVYRKLGFEFCSYEDDKEDGDWIYSNYVQEDLKHIDPIGGKYVYVNKNNEILTLIKEKKSQFDYYAAF